jgi:hypothetical protein
MVDDMPDYVDKRGAHGVDRSGAHGQTTRARALLSLAIGACVAMLASDCSKSHVQETVTVAPRAAVSPAPTITVSNASPAPVTVDAETEATGDALAHAIVALKARHRDEALHYMDLARTRLTRLVNRTAADATAKSNPTRERLLSDLRALDVAERAARRNDYEQSGAELVSITNELDHLPQSPNQLQN